MLPPISVLRYRPGSQRRDPVGLPGRKSRLSSVVRADEFLDASRSPQRWCHEFLANPQSSSLSDAFCGKAEASPPVADERGAPDILRCTPRNGKLRQTLVRGVK
ncbi:hypothetical protein ARTHRO9V_100134 [Arthrobacter sp. 9V]|nr:hypothetical protein ARTHRO9V_100134 [Arthrobacter sp. 9V]